ncbi:MAG: DUF1501 domain-containing protein [Planctomyces sp.]|nr:DUF1501 domain-containing protein [Planctomyces sp.]
MNLPQPFQFLHDAGRQRSSYHGSRSSTGVPRRQVLLSGITGVLGAAAACRTSAASGLAAASGTAAGETQSRSPLAGSSEAPSDSAVSSPRAKSLIIIFLTGAASHHDTFDMKPFAPAEIRGEFQPISTSVPGLQICEHLPRLAARADKYSLIRTLSHGDNNHLMSTHHLLTGHQQPGGFFDKVASRDDWPCYSAACEFLRPRSDGIPAGVNLPTFLMSSPLTWPGQHAGFLGSKYDPWQIVGNPAKDDFRVETLTLSNGLSSERLDQRRSLLNQLNGQQNFALQSGSTARMSEDQRLAFSMLTSSGLVSAFELHREPQAIRDRYGRNIDGQSLLLARRLVLAGVPVVQVNIGPVQNWDNHAAIFQTLKERLLPPLDLGVSALLDDLDESGMLNDTMVIMLGEFGRTPKINKDAGRDHWGPCFFGLFAGAGVRGGQVLGTSDEIGAYPATTAWSPDDVGATIYQALGIDPHSTVRDRLGRPVHLNTGTPIDALYSGSFRS